MDASPDPTPAEPAGLPQTVPTPQGPVLVYSPDRPYRLELYLQPPGPGVVPYKAEVPRGLAVMEPEAWATCRSQARFCREVQTVGLAGATPPSLADAWAGLPRKQAVAMLGRTRDIPTLEALLVLDHHMDVRAAIAQLLADARTGRTRL